MHDFATAEVATGETEIFTRVGGSGPPLLLLHGFPQTHLMWREVAPLLARNFRVVCADLRGYGGSGCPTTTHDHAPYAKRAMARDMVAVMAQLGFRHFSVCGHDRGGRVAYRMALDHPERIDRLAVLDILPIEAAWQYADARLALAYWPWSLLAQPPPLPEQILSLGAEVIIDNALGQWGSSATAFPAEVRAAYVRALQQPEHAHAICEEYRAAASIDRVHDRADRLSRRRIGCPILVLWSAHGPLDTWYSEHGGPLALWRDWADDVAGRPLEGGHFFPESAPRATAAALGDFFRSAPAKSRPL
ncbi:MAG TPA: alpha/beta hydrolase [Hyphomicrobiaceae bacterium]|nr:alpha/beta hydrolase [Hyphomicrobiaceae bacterium]